MLKIRHILMLLCALTMSVTALHAERVTSTEGHHDQDIHDGKIVLNGEGGHVTFTLSGMDINYQNHLGSVAIDAYDLGDVGRSSSQDLTINWTVESGYEIKVTYIGFKGRAYNEDALHNSGGKFVFEGTTYTAGTIWVLDIEGSPWTSISATKTFSNGTKITCKNTLIDGWLLPAYTYTFIIKNLQIDYTLTPIINTKDGSVPVTICSENMQTIDLETCITNKKSHLNYHYSVISANKDDATITGSSFSATQPGAYTIRVTVDAKDGCHQAASADFTVTVQPVPLTLTAPTASDIYYPHTLETSVLTGGSATVGPCVVDGTWAWQTPSFIPNLGNDQPFNVVFTPSSNASCYTNFVTVAYVHVIRAQYIYDGSGNGEGDEERIQWGKPDNWQSDQTPDIYGEVFIRHDVVITETVEAYSVTIEGTNNVTVAPEGSLKVGDGGFIGVTAENFKLQAATTGTNKGKTGALLVDPACATMPNATVELYSKAFFDMTVDDRNNAGSYQYVGSPMVGGEAAKAVFANSWVYSWDESSGEWKNQRKTLSLAPFVGYATSQYTYPEGILIEQKGQLASNGNQVINLSYTATSAEAGINVLANSYSAPIDITRFAGSDFSAGVEQTIYLFNTGSKNDVAAREEQTAVDIAAAGQFIPIPVSSAADLVSLFGYPAVIPSMQGFYVKTDNDGSTLTLDYQRLVWEAANGNTPLRVKRADEQKHAGLCISVEADGWRDQVFLLESEEYDVAFENGFDAHKLMSGNLNIFTVEGEDFLAVDATNRIAGTKIGVRTGEETAYTLTFGALSGETEWALLDTETQELIAIEEEMQYTFFAEPNSEIRDRFWIQERNDAPAITTDIEEVNSGAVVHKFIKDGQLFVIKNGLIYNTMGLVVSR